MSPVVVQFWRTLRYDDHSQSVRSIAGTTFAKGHITSGATLSADEALTAGPRFLGEGYREQSPSRVLWVRGPDRCRGLGRGRGRAGVLVGGGGRGVC
jgi:hypothetical protein